MYTSERHKPCHDKIDGVNLNQSCSFQKLFLFLQCYVCEYPHHYSTKPTHRNINENGSHSM